MLSQLVRKFISFIVFFSQDTGESVRRSVQQRAAARSIIPGDESINLSGVTINASADSIISKKQLTDSIIRSGEPIIQGADPYHPVPHTILSQHPPPKEKSRSRRDVKKLRY